jgi:O-methyltransferase domain/Dimerisation domain
MANADPDSSRIFQIGTGFQSSKTLLSAVELRLFTVLAEGPMTGGQIGERLRLHSRAIYDFLDALVALRLLERDGEGADARYRNTRDTAEFLDADKPTYIGGLLEMCNSRLYGFWGDLTEALRTGEPQNELKHGGTSMFAEVYKDRARLEQFMQAMAGISLESSRALAERFDFSRYRSVCDIGGATGQLSMAIAERHPHLSCTTFDLPIVVPIAEKAVAAAGLTDRVKVASGDFFAEPLPHADVITMARILHDWNLDKKMHLIRAAYEALPEDGVLITIESLIDDARREHVVGLMMSLNMMIEFGDAFDYSAADFARWCREAGFRDTAVLPLTGITGAAVAYK